MTRRGDNRRDRKRDERKLANGATVPERSLAEWIRYAEAERPPDVSITDGVAHVYSDLALNTMASLKAPTAPQPEDPVVKPELIRNQLRFLWADVAFWKQVSAGESDVWLDCSIRAEHGLALPGLSHQAWKQLVKYPARRKQLFEVFEKQEWRWLPVQATLDSEQVVGELKGKWFHKLIDEYLAAPRIAMTRALASQEFSDAALAGC